MKESNIEVGMKVQLHYKGMGYFADDKGVYTVKKVYEYGSQSGYLMDVEKPACKRCGNDKVKRVGLDIAWAKVVKE